jgi:hypothetical protein
MQASSPSRAVFVSGLLIGVAAALGGVLVLRHHDAPKQAAPVPASTKAAHAQTAVLGAAAAPPAAGEDAASCGSSLRIASAGPEDATVSLEPAPAKALPGQGAALLVRGKEAVAGGRPRDAEALFMNACRTAAVDTGPDGRVGMADAKYRLARLYAQAAATAAGAKRDELRSQARALDADSLRIYTARYGAKHEKTQFAAKALAALGDAADAPTAVAQAPAEPNPHPAASKQAEQPKPQPKLQAAAPPPKVAAKAETPKRVEPAKSTTPEPAAAARMETAQAQAQVQAPAPVKPATRKTPVEQPKAIAPPQERAQVAAVPPPAAVAAVTAAAGQKAEPSFDCRRARSTSEKIICGDSELARQDRELGRLHARAKKAAPDPRAFQRDSDKEWQQRESTCQDRVCLQRWYAHRREELASSADDAAPAASPAPIAEATGDAGTR